MKFVPVFLATCFIFGCANPSEKHRESPSREADSLTRLKLSQTCLDAADKFIERKKWTGDNYTSHYNASLELYGVPRRERVRHVVLFVVEDRSVSD